MAEQQGSTERAEETEGIEEVTAMVSTMAQWYVVQERYQGTAQRLAELQELARTGVLTDDEELEQLVLERRQTNLAPVLERLNRDIAYEQAIVNAQSVQANHDAYIPNIEAAVQRIAQGVAMVFQGCQQLAQTHNAQMAALTQLRKPGGAMAFEVPDGREVVKNLVTRMPSPMGWDMALLQPISRPLTQGDVANMLDVIPGAKPLNPRRIEQYVKLFTERQPWR